MLKYEDSFSRSNRNSWKADSKAKDVYQSGSLTKFHVVGKLNKDEDNKIEGLMKSDDKMSFTFQMIDEDGMKEKVFYGEPMPPDFLLSEQVVVIGGYENNGI